MISGCWHFVVKSVCFASALISLWASPLIVISNSCHSLPIPYILACLTSCVCEIVVSCRLPCLFGFSVVCVWMFVFSRNLIHSTHFHSATNTYLRLYSPQFLCHPLLLPSHRHHPDSSPPHHHLGFLSSQHHCLFPVCLFIFIKEP